MTQAQVIEALGKVGALVKDSHVVYTSGRHGEAYVNKDALYPHTGLTSACAREMALPFRGAGVDIALAPALGGIILSQWVAHHLSEAEGREILGVYAEKEGDGFVLRRGYDALVAGKRVLVLEDVLTTGGSVKKVVETVRRAGAEVVGVSALCNRGGIDPQALGGVPRLESLIRVKLDSWEAADCPLCSRGIPVNTAVGKGKEFLARRD